MEWKAGCRNLPRLKVRQFGKAKSDKPYWGDPFIPYPAEVVDCLNTTWERAGAHAEPIPGFEIADGLGLLLEHGAALQALASRAIRTIVENSFSFAALGRAHHRGHVHEAEEQVAKDKE